ncbi:MAG: ABC transporter ATP-binding protein [Bacteroidales bacterium]|nr:ABC transporter ATP-binding protein [Bacteroidales bacterium]
MIEIQDISKSYGQIQAVKNLSLNIRKGEFYSLLGPNGAGKTTTINLLGGLFYPDRGSIRVNGISIQENPNAIKNWIGIVPQEIALYNELTALENLRFWARVNHVSKQGLDAKIHKVLEYMGLADRASQSISKYSGGMKRRINIAAALLHDPSILFFDEPTVGVDPQSRSFIYHIFKDLRAQGKTILYTSHYLEEVELLSDRIGIIDHGELVAEGTFDELRLQSGLKEQIHIQFKKISEEKLEQIAKSPLLSAKSNAHGFVNTESCNYVGSNRTEDLSRLVQFFAEHQIAIEQIEIKPVDLEQVYLHFTKVDLRD